MESPPEAPPPVIPKISCEESNLTSTSVCIPSATADEDDDDNPIPPDHHVSIIRRTRPKSIWHSKIRLFHKDSYKLVRQQQIKNSLLAGVGYLELANAGDFAANVWNDIPVPRHAMILMAIGGPISLCMMLFAIRDFALSWQNVRLLRAERIHLLSLRESLSSTMSETAEKDGEMVRVLDSRLGVGVRELGTEIVDRMVMDALMGVGALLVGVGTIMAIFGANPRVYRASNLLSGYVGNSMAAVFGLVNAVWSGFLIYRFQCHDVACRRITNPAVGPGGAEDNNHSYVLSTTQQHRLRIRCRRFQWHSVVNALNGLVAGAASMVTATRWWGYVVLIPCIISLILCNYFWRWKLGYDRPIITTSTTTPSSFPRHNIVAFLPPLLAELAYVSAVHDALDQAQNLPRSLVDLDSLESAISFIAKNHMFESFCEWLLCEDQSVFALLIGNSDDQTPPPQPSQHTHIHIHGHIGHAHNVLTISPKDFLNGPAHSHQPGLESLLLERARGFIRMFGKRIFVYRERYLLELVGYAVWREQTHPLSSSSL